MLGADARTRRLLVAPSFSARPPAQQPRRATDPPTTPTPCPPLGSARQDPHPALRFLCRMDAPATLGMLREGLQGWDALEAGERTAVAGGRVGGWVRGRLGACVSG